MSQDQEELWAAFSRQRASDWKGSPMVREKLPTGSSGKPVGRLARGVASIVVVTVLMYTPLLGKRSAAVE